MVNRKDSNGISVLASKLATPSVMSLAAPDTPTSPSTRAAVSELSPVSSAATSRYQVGTPGCITLIAHLSLGGRTLYGPDCGNCNPACVTPTRVTTPIGSDGSALFAPTGRAPAKIRNSPPAKSCANDCGPRMPILKPVETRSIVCTSAGEINADVIG